MSGAATLKSTHLGGVSRAVRARTRSSAAPSDSPDTETVCGLGNRKNDLFGTVLSRDGVEAYPGSVRLLDALDDRGTKMAVVSSSANAPDVLRAAGLLDRFVTVVDGSVAKEQKLPVVKKRRPRPATAGEPPSPAR